MAADRGHPAKRRTLGIAAFASLLALFALGPPQARADHPDDATAAEAEFLSPDHAAEHLALRKAQTRALRRWRRMNPAQKRKARARDARRAKRAGTQAQAATLSAGDEADIGRWTVAPFQLPNYAIHAALLPTGKVMFYGYPPINASGRPNEGRAALWDPELGTGPESFTEVPPPVVDHDFNPNTPAVPVPVFCSGQSLLPSGELLVTGGHLVEPTIAGDA